MGDSMSTIINATTTTGVVIQPDNSGSLELQTNNGTAALTISTAQDTTLAGKLTTASTGIQFSDASTQTAAASPYVLKNRIINGDMRIDQRNAGASVTQTNANIYSVDRWQSFGSQASKMTLQQSSTVPTVPTGFTKSLLITSSSAYSITTSDIFIFRQQIEGLNFSDLEWGTANAKTVTLSFWVRSSITGTWGGSLYSTGGTQSYPFTYTISTANTWQQITITVAGPTTGGATTDNSSAAQVIFSLGTGSTNSGTANAWSGSVFYSATGATSLVGTNAATWYVTGVQLEIGTSATPFERRLFGNELVLCQRYCSKTYDVGVAPGANNSAGCVVVGGSSNTANNQQVDLRFKVSMRASPTVTGYLPSGTINTFDFGRNGAAGNTTPTFDLIGENGCRVYANVGAAWVSSSLAGHYIASAEL